MKIVVRIQTVVIKLIEAQQSSALSVRQFCAGWAYLITLGVGHYLRCPVVKTLKMLKTLGGLVSSNKYLLTSFRHDVSLWLFFDETDYIKSLCRLKFIPKRSTAYRLLSNDNIDVFSFLYGA